MALTRSGQSAAIMFAVRAPQSNPPRMAFSICKRIHQRHDVERDSRWLSIAERAARKECRGAVAAEIRDNHAIARTMTLHSRRPPILILSTSVESMAVDFDDGIGESLRSFLRQIVTYTAHNGPVRASA